MRAVNVFLCLVVSALLFLLLFEAGLRVAGLGPQATIHRFDPDTGWSKLPNASVHRSTGEFDITVATNEQGLRDDPMPTRAKPDGTRRVLCVGDSFVLGYTVDRAHLFVDLLEDWWQAEGRPVDVVNAGTEGWSTDQEVAWLEAHAASFQPDVVLLFPYENDLYWNGQVRYRRFPKPRWSTAGPREKIALQDPGPTRWLERTAVGKFASAFGEQRLSWSPDGRRRLEMEYAAYWREPPAFLAEAIERTRSALAGARDLCRDQLGARLVVVPIPGKAAIVDDARAALEAQILGDTPIARLRRAILGGEDPRAEPRLAPGTAWSPDQPVETFLSLCAQLGIDHVDVRAALRASATPDEPLYYQSDWHFDPAGNHAFARILHDELDARGWLPADLAPRRTAALAPLEPKAATHGWIPWFAGLWLLLGTLYWRTYKDVGALKSYAFVGGMLGLVFTIAIGGTRLLGLLPPSISRLVFVAFLLSILAFVLVKLGRRIGTITELLVAFTRRGHWYLMPLVVILLTIGSLLVVAASSPLVAPFIYTLF